MILGFNYSLIPLSESELVRGFVLVSTKEHAW